MLLSGELGVERMRSSLRSYFSYNQELFVFTLENPLLKSEERHSALEFGIVTARYVSMFFPNIKRCLPTVSLQLNSKRVLL